MIDCLTDRTGQDEKVIVSQGSMLVRVEQSINVKAISGRILLEDFQSLGIILDFSHAAHG